MITSVGRAFNVDAALIAADKKGLIRRDWAGFDGITEQRVGGNSPAGVSVGVCLFVWPPLFNN